MNIKPVLLTGMTGVALLGLMSGCNRKKENAVIVPPAESAIQENQKNPKTKTPEEMEKIRIAETDLRSVQVTHDFLQALSWTGKSEVMLGDVVEKLKDPVVFDTKARALQLKAHILMQQDKRAEAIEVYKEAATLTADPNQRYTIMQNIANLLGLMGKSAEQVAVFNQMMKELELPGFRLTVANQLISLYVQEERFDDAVTLYREMAQSKEAQDQPILLSMLGRLVPSLMRLGRNEDALSLVDEYKKANKTQDVTNPMYQQVLLYEVQLLTRKGEVEKARDAVLPTLASVHNKQGFLQELMKVAAVMAAQKKTGAALDLLKKLGSLQNDVNSQGKLVFAMADIDLASGKKEEGVRKLREVQNLFRDDLYKRSGVSFYLANRLKELGDQEGAKKEYLSLLNPYTPFSNVARDELQNMGVTPPLPGAVTPIVPPAPPGQGKKERGVLPD